MPTQRIDADDGSGADVGLDRVAAETDDDAADGLPEYCSNLLHHRARTKILLLSRSQTLETVEVAVAGGKTAAAAAVDGGGGGDAADGEWVVADTGKTSGADPDDTDDDGVRTAARIAVLLERMRCCACRAAVDGTRIVAAVGVEGTAVDSEHRFQHL